MSGFAISHLAVNAGIGFPIAPLLGAGVALILGLITAASALRVRGVSLAVVTLAAVVAITNFGFVNTTWGGGQTGSPVPEPTLFGLDLGPRAGFRGLDGNLPSPVFGWVVLAVTVALCVLVGLLRRGSLGQRMLAVRSNERAAAAAAIDPRAVKFVAFGISSVIAGLAGALYAYNFSSVSADRFDPFTALSLIAFAYAGGITLISGAVFAGLISTQALFPYALDKWFGHQRQLVPAVRRRDPDHHPDPEPRGRRGRVLQADAQAPTGPSARAGGIRRDTRRHSSCGRAGFR